MLLRLLWLLLLQLLAVRPWRPLLRCNLLLGRLLSALEGIIIRGAAIIERLEQRELISSGIHGERNIAAAMRT